MYATSKARLCCWLLVGLRLFMQEIFTMFFFDFGDMFDCFFALQLLNLRFFFAAPLSFEAQRGHSRGDWDEKRPGKDRN